MDSRREAHEKMRKMTELSILTAVIVVLQVICTFIKFGPFSITLALVPIIIGAALHGKGAGAYLGTVFGVVVLVTGLLGWDGGTVLYLLSLKPVAAVVLCIIKGTAAGFAAGVVFKALEKKSTLAASFASGIVCPIVNTGLFIVLALIFFKDVLSSWAGGQNLILYIIFGLTGVNFLIELLVNTLLAAGISEIINASRKVRR